MAKALCNISPVCAYEARGLAQAAGTFAISHGGVWMLPVQAGDSPG